MIPGMATSPYAAAARIEAGACPECDSFRCECEDSTDVCYYHDGLGAWREYGTGRFVSAQEAMQRNQDSADYEAYCRRMEYRDKDALSFVEWKAWRDGDRDSGVLDEIAVTGRVPKGVVL